MIALRWSITVLDIGIRNEIKVTLTVTNFGVFESVPLGRRRTKRLGEDGEGFELDARLVGLGAEQRAGHADEIAKIKVREGVEQIVAERIFLRIAPGCARFGRARQ